MSIPRPVARFRYCGLLEARRPAGSSPATHASVSPTWFRAGLLSVTVRFCVLVAYVLNEKRHFLSVCELLLSRLEQGIEARVVGFARDTFVGDDSRDVPVRRYVESRVCYFDTFGRGR